MSTGFGRRFRSFFFDRICACFLGSYPIASSDVSNIPKILPRVSVFFFFFYIKRKRTKKNIPSAGLSHIFFLARSFFFLSFAASDQSAAAKVAAVSGMKIDCCLLGKLGKKKNKQTKKLGKNRGTARCDRARPQTR